MATILPPSPPEPWSNPAGTDGFEFVEDTAEEPSRLAALFESMGFEAVARHRAKDVTLFRQNGVNFIVNAEPDSFAQSFARVHGPSVCAIAFRVRNAADAYKHVLSLGARPHHGRVGPMELNIPAIKGIGDSLIYLVDRYAEQSIYDVDFVPVGARFVARPSTEDGGRTTSATGGATLGRPEGVRLTEVDHLTHNVYRGRMDVWSGFYETLFNFRQIRYFDIEGKLTGLHSRAMTSPCGKIRIPINESTDNRSQIEEYLAAYHGEGIQHIALATDDIHATVEALRGRGIAFMDPPPDSYYEAVDARLPDHGEDLSRLKENAILIDGAPGPEGGRLLQIFTRTVIGPIFFEIIQRKGDQGFGEGNFQALFESLELDQIRRGVLSES